MKFYSIILLFLFGTIANAQNQSRLTKAQVDSLPNTIENQFIKIYKKSNNWQEYKMIKRPAFLNFQKTVLDSVGILRKDAIIKQQKINNQTTTITSLNDKISELNTKLTASLENRDSISLFGVQMSKTAYNSLLWSVILGLSAGLFFFIFKFKNSNFITKQKTTALSDIEEEFEQFRKRTLEKEQKLRRQLHDEVSKNRT